MGCLLFLLSSQLAAQTSAEFPRIDKYRAVKSALQQLYEKGELPSGVRKGSENPNEYDLADAATCQQPSDYTGFYADAKDDQLERPQHKNDDIADFVKDAVNAVVWENDFHKLGLPEPIWRPVLDRYEDISLHSPSQRIDLAGMLNKNRAAAGRSTPTFVFMGGCGAAGIAVQFSLKPVDGQLFLIPVFLYKVCQAQRLSPVDFKRCDRWKEIVDEHVWNVSGDYVYLARWADGVVRCGTISYDDFLKSADEQHFMMVITKIRSPECSPAF